MNFIWNKKSRAEWNIVINSTNTKAVNIFCLAAFSLNAFLNTLLGVKNSFKTDKIDLYIIYSFCWIICCFIYFFRLFYNRDSNCLAKILPNAKKIYTKKLPTIFCLMNFSVEILLGIAYLTSYLKGKSNPIFFLIFLLFCFLNLLLSVVIRITISAISHEHAITVWGSGLTKDACKLIGVIFGTAGILAGITITLSHFRKILIPFFGKNIAIFVVLCTGFIIASWIVSFRTFYRLYKER